MSHLKTHSASGADHTFPAGAGTTYLDDTGAFTTPPGTGGVTYGTPSLTLGTTNAAGSIAESMRRDATILVFDSTNPVTQAFGDAASPGSGTIAAYRNHKHAMPTAAVTTSGLTQATAKMLGRSTASTGAIEEITVGSGLSLSGGTLSATGAGSSPLTTKGDVWGFSTVDARIPIGTNGYVLTADSTQTLGLKWAAAGSGAVATDTIWDAKGDLAVGTGADTAAKLTVGTDTQIPVADSTQSTGIKWAGDTSWTAPTLGNSWVNFGAPYNNAGYMKDAAGFVHLRGLIKSGTTNSVAYTLPSGYRPSATWLFICFGANSGTDGFKRVDVASSGTVTVVTASPDFLSLDGIIFWTT